MVAVLSAEVEEVDEDSLLCSADSSLDGFAVFNSHSKQLCSLLPHNRFPSRL